KPFEAVVEGDLLYGRGTEDDKGPTAAALVAMRALSAAGYRPRERVQLIIGMGEEHSWDGMVKYSKEMPKPRHVVSLDANFPVVVSEFGFVGWTLVSRDDAPPPTRKEKCARVIAASGGSFLTQVPAEATATLAPPPAESAAKLLARVQAIAREDQAARGAPFAVEVTAAPGDPKNVLVKTTGKSVHSSVADQGANPLWPLAAIADRAGVCQTGPGRLLRVLAGKLDGDHFGVKLGLAYSDPVMGKLLVIPTVLRTEGGRATLGINMRRPAGMDNAAFQEKLNATLQALSREYGPLEEDASQRFLGEPHVADVHGDLVPTLLSIYSELTGAQDPKPIAVRGGTYARLFPGAVSFGPELPGKTYRGHAPDEAIELSTLELLTRAALEVVLRLDPKAAQKR
ncbi:MAG TPA: M20/M25/M40 family metallo-hydrolase, partial [Myxococcales bacterium]|nr:M20/M25/M40 family metallo-hydrolase [Myxococcales bacterium]